MPFAELIAALESLRNLSESLYDICEDMISSTDGRLVDARSELDAVDAAIEKIKQHGPE